MRKLLSIILVLALATTMLVGCADKKEESETEKPAAAATTGVKEEASAVENAAPADDGKVYTFKLSSVLTDKDSII